MAETVAVLVARLEADVKKFEKGMKTAEKRLDKLDRETDKAAKAQKNLGQRMSGVGTIAKGVFAGAAAVAVGRFMGDSVRAATDLGESLNALEVVYKDNAAALGTIGEAAADTFGLSQAAFNQFAVRFSAFAEKIAGESGNVVDTVEEMTGRVADFASVHNIEVEEAAQIVQSALAGETEAFRRFGGDVSAAAVKTKAFELGLGDASGKLTEQEKILARYQLVMEQTSDTAGDFANTSDDLANATRRLAAKFEDAKAKIGAALIPALEDLIPVGEEVVEILVEGASEFGDITGAITPATASLNKFRSEVGPLNAETQGVNVELAGLVTTVQDLKDRTGPNFVDFATKGVLAFFQTAEQAAELESGMVELVDAFDVTAETLAKLTSGAFDDFLTTVGLTQPEIDLLIELLGNKLAQAGRDAFEGMTNVPGGIADIGGAADDATGELEDFADALLAALDPQFAAKDALDDLEEAQDAYKTALSETGPVSDETLAAADRLTEADLRAQAAARAVGDTLDDTRQDYLNAAADAGVHVDTVAAMNDELDELNDKNVVFSVDFNLAPGAQAMLDTIRAMEGLAPTPGPSGGNTPVPSIPILHSGGTVPGPPGSERLIIAEAGETITPAGGMTGSPLLIQLTVDGHVLAEQLVTSDELNRRRGLG
jgi:uncharacterized protein YukE